MGHCGYYYRFIFQYASIAQPPYALIVAYDWIDECDRSFQKLKNTLIEAPILRAPNWNKVLYVHIDAFNFAIGCVLAQPREHNIDFLPQQCRKELNNNRMRRPRNDLYH